MSRDLQTVARTLRGSPKVFGIGMGKTGTTSLERAFVELGYHVGPQEVFERHYDAWVAGDDQALLADIERFEAFQDVPFCLPNTYKLLYEHYPHARFILTVRDSAEQWYNSLCRFHTKIFGRHGTLPTESDLAEATYVSPGWALRVSRIYGTPPGEPYHRETLVRVYETHLREVQSFFASHPGSFLVLNVAHADAYSRLAAFLELPPVTRPFPHLNKST